MDNLQIWNKVKQTPTNFLKEIKFGYLKGKHDINPQWRLMAMTQAFGVVGHGWTYRVVRTWSEPCSDGNVMAFAEVAVKTKLDGEWGEEFSGIGGSTIVDKNKNGIQANDEGYKKAVTDALGVAFKAVGVASDIYLGNFDGSKYLYNYDHAFAEEQANNQQIGNQQTPPNQPPANQSKNQSTPPVKQKIPLTDEQFQRVLHCLTTTGKDKNGNPVSKQTIQHDYALNDEQMHTLLNA